MPNALFLNTCILTGNNVENPASLSKQRKICELYFAPLQLNLHFDPRLALSNYYCPLIKYSSEPKIFKRKHKKEKFWAIPSIAAIREAE